MNKKEITEFFNKCARAWDEWTDLKKDAVECILERSCVTDGSRVLDIGCGTGVLFGYYFSRGAAEVTGVDISQEMVELARCKFPEAQIMCADAEEAEFEQKYDLAMVFNALPHFVNPEKLIASALQALVPGGRLMIAHDTGREELNQYHGRRAAGVSCELMEAEVLAEMMAKSFDVDTIISDEEKYIVSGLKK